jgi:hypothetical protein
MVFSKESKENTATFNIIHNNYIQIIPRPHQNMHYYKLPNPYLCYSHLLRARFIAQICTWQYSIDIKAASLACMKFYLKSSGLNIP